MLLKLQNKLYLDTEFEEQLNRAFQKISWLLPAKTLELIEKLGSIFVVKEGFAKDYSGKEEIVTKLIEAALQKNICKVKYYAFSSQTEKSYEIEP